MDPFSRIRPVLFLFETISHQHTQVIIVDIPVRTRIVDYQIGNFGNNLPFKIQRKITKVHPPDFCIFAFLFTDKTMILYPVIHFPDRIEILLLHERDIQLHPVYVHIRLATSFKIFLYRIQYLKLDKSRTIFLASVDKPEIIHQRMREKEQKGRGDGEYNDHFNQGISGAIF